MHYLSEYEGDHLLGLPVGGVDNVSEGGGRQRGLVPSRYQGRLQ